MASILLRDLNDFVEPSVACIKQAKAEEKRSKPVALSLKDCLACSGCITTSEALLVTSQSVDQVHAKLQEPQARCVFLIAPQSAASFAVRFGWAGEEAIGRLLHCVRQLPGVQAVYDASSGSELHFRLASSEFMERFRSLQDLPVVCSTCPGWVCYAEKKQPFTLPLLSRVRSPQQLLARAVRQSVGAEAFVIAVAMCHDKKLEAAREDFQGDVDCVLTTIELLELFDRFKVSVGSVGRLAAKEPFDRLGQRESPTDQASKFGSETWLEGILRVSANSLCPDFQLTRENFNSTVTVTERGRAGDFTEYSLNLPTGERLNFAAVYGFRAIQSLVRMLRFAAASGKPPPFHYAEVMACPSGCLNGAGQLPPTAESGRTVYVSELRTVYATLPQGEFSLGIPENHDDLFVSWRDASSAETISW